MEEIVMSSPALVACVSMRAIHPDVTDTEASKTQAFGAAYHCPFDRRHPHKTPARPPRAAQGVRTVTDRAVCITAPTI